MNIKIETKKTEIFAAITYFFIILSLIDFPIILKTIFQLLACFAFHCISDQFFDFPLKEKLKSINYKMIIKELLMYIVVIVINTFFLNFLLNAGILESGVAGNQLDLEKQVSNMPIFLIYIVVVGPIFEELIFRLLPSKFLKNKWVYIIVTGIIFASLHVINYENPLNFIWFYIVGAFYYGYRYYKTKDILVPISLHILNNFISIIL